MYEEYFNVAYCWRIKTEEEREKLRKGKKGRTGRKEAKNIRRSGIIHCFTLLHVAKCSPPLRFRHKIILMWLE